MKISKQLILQICLVACLILCSPAKGLNFTIAFNDTNYTFFYDIKEVDFSDVDSFQIMYHGNIVKHCGNSVIRYLVNLVEGNMRSNKCVVKHIDVNYMAPLAYLQEYRIIGAITNYKNTSFQVSVYGIGYDKEEIDPVKAIMEKMQNVDFNSLNKIGDDTATAQAEHNYEVIEEAAEESSEDNNTIKEDEKRRYVRGFTKTIKNNCQIYFNATYTLVRVDKLGEKELIPESFKKKYPHMCKESFENLVRTLC